MDVYLPFVQFLFGVIFAVITYHMGRKRGYREGSRFVLEEWKKHIRNTGGDNNE